MVPDNVFIGPHLRPLPRCRLIASIKFHRATTMSFKCISSAAVVAYSAAHRIACALYDLFYRLGRFMPSSVQHLHTRLWRTCCTKFVLFLGRVLALITRLAFLLACCRCNRPLWCINEDGSARLKEEEGGILINVLDFARRWLSRVY